jgi:hypothetical protein
MVTVSPFSLILNVAFSGVSELDASPMPRLCNARSQSQSKFLQSSCSSPGRTNNPNARDVC